MPTTLDYKTAIIAKGFDAVTQASAILGAINAARTDLANERRWGCLQVLGNTSLTTTIGSPIVATTGIADLLYIDAVRLQQGTTQGWDLDPIDLQEFRRLENLDRANGMPNYWAAAAGASPAAIRVGPRPDQVYTLVVDYVKQLTDLAADADPDVFPVAFKSAIVWKACEHLSFRTRQPDALQLAQRAYGFELAKLSQAEGLGQRQSSEQVASSGYWDWCS